MASYLISDEPYAAWLSEVLATLAEHKATSICVAALMPDGETFTGYFNMKMMDKALVASSIQADAILDGVCTNGDLIRRRWDEEGEEGTE